jgi:hypothetical protein
VQPYLNLVAVLRVAAFCQIQGRIRVGIGLASQSAPAVKQTNWPKRAAFTVMVVLGLVFWIPALLRATVGDGNEVAGQPEYSVADTPSTLDADISAAKPAAATTDDSQAGNSSRSGTDAIVLTAAILGKTRRAAIVNGRLHREGDRIAVAGELFRLTSVTEDRIELLRAGKGSEGDRHLTIRMMARHDNTK